MQYILSEQEYQNLKNHYKEKAEKYKDACILVEGEKFVHFIDCLKKLNPELFENGNYPGFYNPLKKTLEYHQKTWDKTFPKFEEL